MILCAFMWVSLSCNSFATDPSFVPLEYFTTSGGIQQERCVRLAGHAGYFPKVKFWDYFQWKIKKPRKFNCGAIVPAFAGAGQAPAATHLQQITSLV
jgi:hypothetical protein